MLVVTDSEADRCSSLPIDHRMTDHTNEISAVSLSAAVGYMYLLGFPGNFYDLTNSKFESAVVYGSHFGERRP